MLIKLVVVFVIWPLGPLLSLSLPLFCFSTVVTVMPDEDDADYDGSVSVDNNRQLLRNYIKKLILFCWIIYVSVQVLVCQCTFYPSEKMDTCCCKVTIVKL